MESNLRNNKIQCNKGENEIKTSNTTNNSVGNTNGQQTTTGTMSTNVIPTNGSEGINVGNRITYLISQYSSSTDDTDNEDEFCVYTYKGRQDSDLPVPNTEQNGQRCPSPDMDYLEMDFEPETPTEQTLDVTDRLIEDFDNIAFDAELSLSSFRNEVNGSLLNETPSTSKDVVQKSSEDYVAIAGPSGLNNSKRAIGFPLRSYYDDSLSDDSTPEEENPFEQNRRRLCTYRKPQPKKFVKKSWNQDVKKSPSGVYEVEEIWEAGHPNLITPPYIVPFPYVKSDSGARAALYHLFQAFNLPQYASDISIRVLDERTLEDSMSLTDTILHKFEYHTTQQDLIDAIHKKTDLRARFFPMYPMREFDILSWIAKWMSKGAVAIVTHKRQLDCEKESDVILDLWQHQMIYRVDKMGVHVTNGVQCISERDIMKGVCQPSTILMKKTEVYAKWLKPQDIKPLLKDRFKECNVIGQLAFILREIADDEHTKHFMTIPTNVAGGVTLVMSKDSQYLKDLWNAPELPLSVIN